MGRRGSDGSNGSCISFGSMPTTFYDCLDDLRKHHEKEVLSLRAEVDRLKEALAKATVSPDFLKKEKHLEPSSEVNELAMKQVFSNPSALRGLRNKRSQKRAVTLPALATTLPRTSEASDRQEAEVAMSSEADDRASSAEDDMALGEDEVVIDVDGGRYHLRKEWWQNPMTYDASRDIVRANVLAVRAHVRNIADAIHGGAEGSFSSVRSKRDRRSRNASSTFAMSDLGQVRRDYCLMKPGEGRLRVTWDVAGMVLVAYDMVAVPLQVGFDTEPDSFTNFMSWLTLIFWTADMVASLRTAYFDKKGVLVTDSKSIIINYFKGWFWVDCIVVGPDWTMKMLGDDGGSRLASMGKVFRAFRAFRLLRLLRLLKLRRMLMIVYDRIDSERLFLGFSLIQLLLMILVMNHFVACGWFLVGRAAKEFGSERNWLEDAGQTPVQGESLAWKYLTSLHWSITQFTPASMDISATNELERLFSIVILFWALLALSSIIGSVTASMTALRNISQEENKHFWTLRRYLRQNLRNRSGEMDGFMERIFRFLEARSQKTQNIVPESKVVLLNQLSDSFRYELANYINSKYVRKHPFFGYLIGDGYMKQFMWRLCFVALKSVCFAQEDIVFSEGDEGMHMYFVKSGDFHYWLTDWGDNLVPLKQSQAWISEGSLWTDWRHRGRLTAATENSAGGCELLLVQPAKFISELRLNPRTWFLGRQYGFRFVAFINTKHGALTDFIFERTYWEVWVQAADARKEGIHSPRSGAEAETGILPIRNEQLLEGKDIGQDLADQ